MLPATIFFLVWYFGFIVLAGYAPDFMGESVYEGLTVGYVLALTQFVMTWVPGLPVPAPRRPGVRPAGRGGRRPRCAEGGGPASTDAGGAAR